MALTRKLLEGIGLDEKQADTVIEAHSETVDALKADRDKYKQRTAEIVDLKRELEEAKGAVGQTEALKQEVEGLKAKLDEADKANKTAKEEFDAYRADVEAKAARRATAKAYRKQVLEAAGIAPSYLDDVMGVTKLDGITLDNDGNVPNAESLVAAVKDKWKSFVVKTKTEGADVATPPESKGNDKEQPHERAKQIAKERHERLYGKSEE